MAEDYLRWDEVIKNPEYQNFLIEKKKKLVLNTSQM